MKYDLYTLKPLLLNEAQAGDYISSDDLASWLLRRPDSLLFMAIRHQQHDPDLLRRRLTELRPVAKLPKTDPPKLSQRLQQLITEWEQNNQTSEEQVTLALLEVPGALRYLLAQLKIANLADGVQQATIVTPVRLDTPLLNKGRNLTSMARRGLLLPCIGRDQEIHQLMATLLRMTKNTPVLVGAAGVGKTAVVEGLAQLLVTDAAPMRLHNCILVEFPVSLFTAGHGIIGEMEKFANKFISELRNHPDIIVFLDEIHTIIGAGTYNTNANDIAQILKPALARGEIKIIGATTEDEYRSIEKDAAFERRMNPIQVREPNIDNAIKMLTAAQSRLETHHKLHINAAAIRAAVTLSVDYLPRRRLPDKAFDLLDTACAAACLTNQSAIERQHIVQALAQITGFAVSDVEITQAHKLDRLETALNSEIIGQTAALQAIVTKLKLAYSGVSKRDKPLGVFLFLGDPGTGKTQVAKSLAANLFGNTQHLIRFDMGEFNDAHSISRLIGSPPGYVGYEESGRLTEFLKNHPHAVILFDEIEKAHYRIADVLLTLFGEGQMADARGRPVDARHTICIMTSNHGIETARTRHLLLGEIDAEQHSNRIKKSLTKAFRPELLNRLDEVIVFKKLTPEHLQQIATLHLQRLGHRMQELGTHIDVAPAIAEYLATEAIALGTGARDLLRLLEEKVTLPLSEWRLAGNKAPHLRILLQKQRIIIEEI